MPPDIRRKADAPDEYKQGIAATRVQAVTKDSVGLSVLSSSKTQPASSTSHLHNKSSSTISSHKSSSHHQLYIRAKSANSARSLSPNSQSCSLPFKVGDDESVLSNNNLAPMLEDDACIPHGVKPCK